MRFKQLKKKIDDQQQTISELKGNIEKLKRKEQATLDF